MFRTMPAMPGAAEALWRLSDAGVWIRIITHRLYVNWGHATAVADTVEWLDASGIPYRDLCFLGAKPQVEADCYVDDAPTTSMALRATGAHVIVFDQPYNRDTAGPRAANWAEVENLVGSPGHRAGPDPAGAAARLRGRGQPPAALRPGETVQPPSRAGRPAGARLRRVPLAVADRPSASVGDVGPGGRARTTRVSRFGATGPGGRDGRGPRRPPPGGRTGGETVRRRRGPPARRVPLALTSVGT